MKYCLKCKHAKWYRDAAGRMHRDGGGKCGYPWKMPQLPAAMYWMGNSAPQPLGGYINRRKELKDHCPYYGEENQ